VDVAGSRDQLPLRGAAGDRGVLNAAVNAVLRGQRDDVLSCALDGETLEVRLRSGRVLVFSDTRLTVFSPPLAADT